MICQGIDGYRGGWVGVRLNTAGLKIENLSYSSDLMDLLDNFEGITAIDMPIGLPRVSRIGGRTCDREVRKYLGMRQSSVFSVPSRISVYQRDYRTSCAAALQTSCPPRKVSRQIFNIFPKMRILDGLLNPQHLRIYEAHPEFAFVQANNKAPLETPKKVKNRPNPEGLAQRRSLLSKIGICEKDLLKLDQLPPFIGQDDRLDAAIIAWTATKIAKETASVCPEAPEYDERGLPMQIYG